MNQDNKKSSKIEMPKDFKVKTTELPEELVVTGDFCIGEPLGKTQGSCIRVLLHPSPAHIEDMEIGLKLIINEIVRRYNQLVPRYQLWQMLHKIHQKRSKGGDKYEMIAQRQFDQNGGKETQKEFQAWMDDVQKRHPVPHKVQWYICNEKDNHFVWAVAEKGEVYKEGEKLAGVSVETAKVPVDPPRPKNHVEVG